eukprot:CAMPEP_0176497102 /NCGR_PEP_ID=MMETSP0200_2-20121128/11541_1 /TAXON_ID=947934 /ORGANISM="Chaetoceros sp., Strain GSL56" /LENGTH=244 /DNA_ID=CAMNT_0017895085 /DNA_START=192 /DNA_END=926 /DNA_ORIENTATION=+
MAEGWARKWISDQIEILGSDVGKLEKLDEGNEKESSSLSSDNGHDANNFIQEKIAMLKNTVVVSVALDSSSVFKTSSDSDEGLTPTVPGNNNNARVYRKHIKSKAVEAMKKEGIDITSHQPKTVDEIMHVIRNDSISLPESLPSSLPSKPFVFNETLTREIDENQKMDEKPTLKTVDKLIVLCSCGEMDDKLVKRSKSIEEWQIDAPTAACKAGEGDLAYTRVSLQIKDEVNNLMKQLILGHPL